MVERYTNISLPDELILEIDRVVKLHSLGYKNRAELCKEAIRIHLQQLADYEQNRPKHKTK